MKILQLGKYYYPHMGGIENHLHQLSSELVKLGNDVTVSVSNNNLSGAHEAIDGVKVDRAPLLITIFNAPVIIPMKPKGEKFDIVHVHLPNPIASISALSSQSQNIVVTYHSDVIKDGMFAKSLNHLYTKFVLTPLLDRAKVIIATSPNYVAGSKILQKYKKKVRVVPYSIDLELFKLNKSNKKTFTELQEKYKGKRIILFIGRLVPYKGLEFLIRAMPAIRKEIENVNLVIVGDGVLKQQLEKMVLELGLDDCIEFIPGLHNEKLSPYYFVADLFVLPSIYKAEAFGIVQLEAMACGKPVVSTNVFGSGISFANKNGETGLVVPPRDAEQLSKSIISILADGNLRKLFGRNSKLRVKKYFSKDLMVKRTLDIYKSILAHH